MRRVNLIRAGALVLLAACDIVDPPPADPGLKFEFTVVSGAGQVGLPGALLSEPISVRLFDRILGTVVVNRAVTFTADPDDGLQFESLNTVTDTAGIASVQVRLGQTLGRHDIRIDFAGNPESAAVVTVESAALPVITSVSPQDAASEGHITISGQNFGAQPNWNDVRVGTLRATVVKASTSELKVLVPRCLSSGTAEVVVRRGSLQSAPSLVTVAGPEIRPQVLEPGATVTETQNPGCMRVAAQPTAARYLVMPLNVSQEGAASSSFKLFGSSGAPPSSAARLVFAQSGGTRDVSLDFEAQLRRADALLAARAQRRPAGREQALARIAPPQLGDQKVFIVNTQFAPQQTVTGVVRALGRHIVIYVDREASGLTGELLQPIVRLFDEVIYDTDVSVFGQPSDIDNNGRVAVIITPAVNRLTPAGSKGYISGFFIGCDLVTPLECLTTNSGEILYALAPDPEGEFGLKHSVEAAVRMLPATIAHEFMHAIHFNQRTLRAEPTSELGWLQEGLAHSAEDTVAAVLYSRGDTALAREIMYQNHKRASLFLAATGSTSLVADGAGTLEERGAAWLMLKYLRQRVDPAILGKLTRSRDSGSANLVALSGLPWSTLVRDWATALYVATSPELNGVVMSPAHSFGNFDLRTAVSSVTAGAFPLAPRTPGTADFGWQLQLPPSSASYMLVDVPAGEEFYLTLSSGSGRDAAAPPALSILRVR